MVWHTMNKLDPQFLSMLVCPDCRGRLTEVESPRALRCTGCGREHEITDDGILCLLPLNPPKLPSSYDDPDYKRMSEMFDDASDYFTDGNQVFSAIHKSGHKAISRWREAEARPGWTCDLGCGTGYHYQFVKSLDRYIGVDIRLESLRRIRSLFPNAFLIQANSCALPFRDGAFATIVSIYALEHIYHLSQTIDEADRVLENGGRLLIGLPCEGGLPWTLGRKLTSERDMSRRYQVDYSKYKALDHCNTARAVLRELGKHFAREATSFFPVPFVPMIDANLIVSAAYRKKTS